MISHSSPAIFFLWMEKLTSDCNIFLSARQRYPKAEGLKEPSFGHSPQVCKGPLFRQQAASLPQTVSHIHTLLPKIIRIVLHHIIFPHELFDFLPVTQVFMMCLLPGDISRHRVYF